MSRRRRLLPAAIVLTTALLLAPAAANAANRYASPTGTALDSCADSMAPCSISRAVNFASSGDDVTLLGGVPPGSAYSTSNGLNIPTGVSVHGAPGARPVVNFSLGVGEDGFYVPVGSTLRDVVADSTSQQTALIDAIGGTVERVSAHSSGTGDYNYTCAGGTGAVFRDSVCWFSGPAASNESNSSFAAFSQVSSDTVTLRNVTIFAPNANGLNSVSFNNQSMTVNATNVIARGGAADVKTSDFGSGIAQTVNLDHSNYATRDNSATGTITDPATGANQTPYPAFVDAANGDFHEASTSSGTLDLGSATGLLPGELDADGAARVLGSAPDIGGYEFAPVATPVAQPPTAPTSHKKKCKKGSKLKKVKGKKKCVKKKKK